MTIYSGQEKLASSSRGSPKIPDSRKVGSPLNEEARWMRHCSAHNHEKRSVPEVAEENEIAEACIMCEDAKEKYLLSKLHTERCDLSALKETPDSPTSPRGDKCISIRDSDRHGIRFKYTRFLEEKKKNYYLRKFKKSDSVPVPLPLRDIKPVVFEPPLFSEDDEKMIQEDLSKLETEVTEQSPRGDKHVSIKDSYKYGFLCKSARVLDEKIQKKYMDKFKKLDSVPVPMRDIMPVVFEPPVFSEDDKKMIQEALSKLETEIYANEEPKIEKTICEMHKVAEEHAMAEACIMSVDAKEKFLMNPNEAAIATSKKKRAYQTSVSDTRERKRRIKLANMLPSSGLLEPIYLGDIYKHLQEEEKKNSPLYDYLVPNFIMGFGPNYRQRLVNWLIEVGDKLFLNQFIICHTVAYFDYYFSVPTNDMEKDPVLVGIICLRIASRYISRLVPDLKSLISLSEVSDVENWSSKKIIKEDVAVMMEDLIVRKMNYCLGRPTAKTFVQLFERVDETSHRDFGFVSEILISFSLLTPVCIMRLPSLVAVAIFFLAKLITEDYVEQQPLSLKVVEFSGYRISDVEECIIAIHSSFKTDIVAVEVNRLAMKYEMLKGGSRFQRYTKKLLHYSTKELREIVTGRV